MACSQGTSAIVTLGGVDYRTGERYVSYETIKGGLGARPIKDTSPAWPAASPTP